MDVITSMENLLDPEITYQVLDSCACGTSITEIKELKRIDAETIGEGSCIVDPFNEAPLCKLGGNFMDKFGVLWGFMAVG